MKLLLTLSCLLAVSTAYHIAKSSMVQRDDVVDVDINEVLREQIESLREIIPDPIELDEQAVNNLDLGGLISLSGGLKNVKLSGLTSFVLENIELNMANLRFDFSFVFPDIRATGWYDLGGNFGNLIPIFGLGDFDIEAFSLELTGYAYLGGTPDGFLELPDFYLRIKLGSVHSNIEGLLKGEDLGKLLNYVISDMTPNILENFHVPISESIKNAVIPLANSILNELTIMDLLELLVPPSTARGSTKTSASIFHRFANLNSA